MCGIAGYVSSQKLNHDAMIQCLDHRGPDHQGYYQETIHQKEVCLGHTRLSIIDLSEQGNQPMFSDNKEIVIVFNGEIYNFKDLQNTYLKNESLHSKTDTEVILKLYEKLGIDFIHHLNGDFAISILDKHAGKLFLIKDRVGVKPLYYYFNDDKLVFGSEIKAIIKSGIKAELNEEELLNYFVFKYVPKQNTLHKNIKRITPGNYLEYSFDTNSIQLKKYWELKKQDQYTKLSYTDAQSVLYDLVSDSTNIRLMADVPIGNFLSGGLDSSILAYFLKNKKDIIHYCAQKSDADLKKEGTSSDFYYASLLAKEWNLNLLAAPIGKEEANLELIKKTLFYSDDLIADGSQIPSYLITKNASQSSKVILSGMGADEIFLGYAGHMLTLLSSKFINKIPFGLSSLIYGGASKIDQGKGKFLAYRRYLHKIGKYGNYPTYKYGILNLVGDFENSSSIYDGDKDRLVDSLSNYFPEKENIFDSLMHFELENVLVKNLNYSDRMSMANSVECRVPFLDHRIVEFAYSIPRDYKLSNTGKSKKILKDTFQKQLPAYIINRRKAGFGMPLRSIFSSQETINHLLDKSFFSNFKGFSLKQIDIIIANHISGKEDNSSIIYALISFQEWYKLNFN